MTAAPISFEIKSQLAKLLATENITMRHNPSARTAYFDIKNRLLVLPVWHNISEDLYDMLVVHEVGHALDTPPDAWETGIETIAYSKHGPNASDKQKNNIKDFLNVIEDARIDKRQKRRYPGSKRNYVVGYKELHDKNFFGVKDRDIDSLPLIDRVNIFFKNGAQYNIKFSDAEKAFISRIENAETFSDVIGIASDMYSYGIEEKKQAPSMAMNIEDSDEESDGMEFDEDSEFESDSDDDMDSDSDSQSDDSDDSESNSGTPYSGEPIDETEEQKSPHSDEEDTAESLTERASKSSQDKIIKSENVDYVYVDIPEFVHSNIVDDYKVVLKEWKDNLEYRKKVGYITNDMTRVLREDLAKFKTQEKAAVSFMVKEFEQKKAADLYSRTSIAKTGVLDMNKIHSYKYNEDLFRKMSVVSEGKNHGFVMLLDWSGSMHENIKETMKHLFSLVMFCNRIQVPFEVFTFRSICSSDDAGTKVQVINKDPNSGIFMHKFKLRNILSSRMNLATLNEAMFHLWSMANVGHYSNEPMSDTPLNQAILSLDKIVLDFQKKNKLQIVNTIVLTDGASNYWSVRTNMPRSVSRKQVLILTDTKTKKVYYPVSNDTNTDICLRVLKDRTRCNLVGFFLYSGNIYNISYMFNSQTIAANTTKWKNDGFFGVTSAGYDEYYIMNVAKLKFQTDNLKVDSKMTKSRIAKEFTRFTNKKTVNRVLLSKFVDRIAK